MYVCNLRPQPPETAGFDGADHLRAVLAHGVPVDVMVVAEPPGPPPRPDGSSACRSSPAPWLARMGAATIPNSWPRSCAGDIVRRGIGVLGARQQGATYDGSGRDQRVRAHRAQLPARRPPGCRPGGERALEVVAINDIVPAATNAHLLKYDSVHGMLTEPVSHDQTSITAR